MHDPSRPARPLDVLDSGDDRPPRPNPLTPKRVRLLALVLLVAAVVAGGLEVRERRVEAAQERRLDRVVDLAVEPRSATTGYDPVSGRATLELQVRLLNRGPRDLAVERGTLGDYQVVQRLAEVTAGGYTALTLRKEVTCSPTEPPAAAPLDALVLDLRTAAGPRTVELPLDPSLLTDGGPRACGFLPLEEALSVEVLAADRSERGVEVTLALTSASNRPLTLTGVRGSDGLSVSAAPLPVVLPSQVELGPLPRNVSVVVAVAECTAARPARPQLELLLRDDRGRVAQPLVGYDPRLLSGLLADSCPG